MSRQQHAWPHAGPESRGALVPTRAGRSAPDAGGFTLVELVVVMAIIGLLSLAAAPAVAGYLREMTVRNGAQELASLLQRARQLAISANTTVCVAPDTAGTRLALQVGACGGAPWLGPGTDASGWLALVTPVVVSPARPNVRFSNLGAATPAGTYVVTDQARGLMRQVVVSASGRISLP